MPHHDSWGPRVEGVDSWERCSVCRNRGRCGLDHECPRIDGDRLSGVVGLVDSHEAVGQLKHVVAQADDYELRILGALLYVVRHNAHVLEVCTGKETRCEYGF